MELERHQTKTIKETVRAWTDLPTDERKRQAARAANDKDVSGLWGLTKSYLLRGRDYSERTLQAYERNIEKLVEAWQHVNLLRPTADDGHLYRLTLKESGLKVASIQQALSAAKALYAALRWTDATTAAPFADVKAGKDPVDRKEKRKPYADSDLARLYQAATDPTHNTDPTTALMLLLAGQSGLRASELLGLTWGDLDTRARTVLVRHGKGDRQRTAPLSRDAIALIEGLEPVSSSKPIFAAKTTHALRDRMRRLCGRADVAYKGLHSLRHTAGTAYAEAGSLDDAARLLGHSNIETTRVYVDYVAEKRMHKLADKLTSVRTPLLND